MDKLKTSQPKKSLIRNTEQPLPQTTVTYEHDEKLMFANENYHLDNAPVFKNKQKPDFLFSHVYKQSSVDSEKSNQPILNERTLKCLNFPLDKKVFKDLIPLSVEDVGKKSKRVPSRISQQLKDEEPNLSDFINAKPHHEYVYQVPVTKQEKCVSQNYDGQRVYNIMLNWK